MVIIHIVVISADRPFGPVILPTITYFVPKLFSSELSTSSFANANSDSANSFGFSSLYPRRANHLAFIEPRGCEDDNK